MCHWQGPGGTPNWGVNFRNTQLRSYAAAMRARYWRNLYLKEVAGEALLSSIPVQGRQMFSPPMGLSRISQGRFIDDTKNEGANA